MDHQTPTTPRERCWIALEGAVNARVVAPGVLVRTDNLQALTPRDVRTLRDQHTVGLVIDLRTEAEVRSEGPGPLTAEPGMRFEHRSLYPAADKVGVPVIWAGGAGERTTPYDDESPYVAAYARYLLLRPDSIVAAVRAIADGDGGVLVHCAAGKDRTGIVVAMALDAAGVDREAIIDDYLASRDRIDRIFARLVSSETYRAELEGRDPQSLAPAPGTLERIFEIVDSDLGGTIAWLAGHGLTAAELTRLRTRLAGALATTRTE